LACHETIVPGLPGRAVGGRGRRPPNAGCASPSREEGGAGGEEPGARMETAPCGASSPPGVRANVDDAEGVRLRNADTEALLASGYRRVSVERIEPGAVMQALVLISLFAGDGGSAEPKIVATFRLGSTQPT
jgi:hypothetical protein